jgi:hypothetical protein
MEAQERIGTWWIWGFILLCWIVFFLVLALMSRATGCNRSSEAGTQSMDIVAESVGFEARAKNGPLQRVQQSSLSSQQVSSFGSNGETARWSRVPASPNGIRDSEGGQSKLRETFVREERI